MAQHTYSMSVNANAGGQFCSNILHFQFDDGGYTTTAQAANALCTAWDAAKTAAFKAMLSIHVTLLSLRGRALNVTGGFEGSILYPAGAVGSRTGNLMAAGQGPCVVFYPVGNAKQRGRLFLPGISDLDCFDGIITGTFKAVINAQMITILTPFALAGGGAPVATPVVYSRKPPPTSRTIFAAQVSPMVAQTRRRQIPV